MNCKAMSDQLVKVARKGQVTISVELRKKYGIREGTKILARDDPKGILLTPVPPMGALAGIDAGKVTIQEMKNRLDRMRSKDRH